MKKVVALLLTAAFIVTSVATVWATNKEQVDVYENEQLVKSIVFAVGSNEYYVNGETPGIKMDAKVFIENDRTYVPVRYLGRALGVADENITWNDTIKQATLIQGDTVLEMTSGKKEIVTNGQKKSIDVEPLLRQNPAWRIHLPAKYVAEGLGYDVEWDPATRTVLCWPQGTEKPDVSAVKQYITEQKQEQVQPEPQPQPEERQDVVGKEYDPRYEDVTDKFVDYGIKNLPLPWEK